MNKDVWLAIFIIAVWFYFGSTLKVYLNKKNEEKNWKTKNWVN